MKDRFSKLNWTSRDYELLLSHIKSLADEEYKNFSQKLIPNIDNIIGVRLPCLRKLAKEISKGDYMGYLKVVQSSFYEEIMLQGLVIGYIKTDLDRVLDLTREFIPKINNWAVCDSFCAGLKIVKKDKVKVFEFLQDYIFSKKEFESRFGFIMLMDYYIDEKYLDKIFEICDSSENDCYYVKMAIAWLISVCFIKFEDKTIKYLSNCKIPKWTYNKALQKIIESNRVDNNTKNMIRRMKV